MKDEAIREAAREMLTATVEGRGVDRREGILRTLWLKAEAETARRCAEIAHGTCFCAQLTVGVETHIPSCVVRREQATEIRSEFGLGEGKG